MGLSRMIPISNSDVMLLLFFHDSLFCQNHFTQLIIPRALLRFLHTLRNRNEHHIPHALILSPGANHGSKRLVQFPHFDLRCDFLVGGIGILFLIFGHQIFDSKIYGVHWDCGTVGFVRRRRDCEAVDVKKGNPASFAVAWSVFDSEGSIQVLLLWKEML